MKEINETSFADYVKYKVKKQFEVIIVDTQEWRLRYFENKSCSY